MELCPKKKDIKTFLSNLLILHLCLNFISCLFKELLFIIYPKFHFYSGYLNFEKILLPLQFLFKIIKYSSKVLNYHPPIILIYSEHLYLTKRYKYLFILDSLANSLFIIELVFIPLFDPNCNQMSFIFYLDKLLYFQVFQSLGYFNLELFRMNLLVISQGTCRYYSEYH